MIIVIKKAKDITNKDILLNAFGHLLRPAKIIKFSKDYKNKYVNITYESGSSEQTVGGAFFEDDLVCLVKD